uniref:Integrase core domain containing protein n=1 Tax=Solanum tuberosum TaxID=4113 RepID=M1DCI6_SOLTU
MLRVKKNDVVEVRDECETTTEQEAEISQKVVPIPRPPPPFPQRLVKKTEDGHALVDMEKGQMKFRLNNEETTFNICRSMKQSGELQTISTITYRVESWTEVQIEERLGVEALAAVMMNFDSDGIEEYDELVAALDRLIDEDTDTEKDPAYIPPNTRTSPTSPRATRGTPWKSAFGSESADVSGSESSHASGSESAHALGSNAQSATGSSQNEQASSSDEATSSESVPIPRNENPTLVTGEPNRWCVEGQWQIYRDAKMIMTKRRFLLFLCRYSLWLDFQAVKAHSPDPLTSTMVRGCPSDAFQRNAEQRESVILWLAKYIAADGERVEWVAAPWLGIQKATLNFGAKFFWLLVRNRVSPTKADNQLTWDRTVIVAALVAVVEIEFAHMLLIEIHKRAFKTSTTYPFLCLIFQLCRASGVPIWHCDRLIHPTGTLDIGLLQDEATVAAPSREPKLSGTAEEGLEPTYAKGKRHCSSRTEEEKAQKRQHRQEKETMKALILDEELSQRRVRESAAGASSSAPVVHVPPVMRDVVSTTDGVMMDDVGTTEGDPTIVPAGFGKPNPPARS